MAVTNKTYAEVVARNSELEIALADMLVRFATTDWMNAEDKPKTFACHHSAETCPSCVWMVTAWKTVKAARKALGN